MEAPPRLSDTSARHDAAESSHDPVLPDGVERIADLVYATRVERELRLDVLRLRFSEGPFPAVILIHGGRPSPRDRHHHALLAAQLADLGVVAVCIDYREALDAPYPAAVPISAAVDLVATDRDDHWSMRIFLGGRPHENPELWRQASPTVSAGIRAEMFTANSWSTPEPLSRPLPHP